MIYKFEKWTFRAAGLVVPALAVCVLQACGGGGSATLLPAPVALTCNDTMKAAFKPDVNTTITLVKAFKTGESVALSGTPTTPAASVAPFDLCLVKMNIGPGNPGPVGAPSTSPGIGVQVLLPSPSAWNKNLIFFGTGGYSGAASISDLTQIQGSLLSDAATTGSLFEAAAVERAVGATADGGNAHLPFNGDFLMDPDGSISTAMWNDFSKRADHEMTLKVKALAAAFYLTAQKYSYFIGTSGGGREAYQAAQSYPEDYDGIFVDSPAINWTKFIVNELYPQIVMLRDLGGKYLTVAQQDLATAAAVSACDTTLTGQHDGYISDPTQCRYDVTKDPTVLCTSAGGSNITSACLSVAQATAVNKIWYGQTADGSVPDRAVDNGLNTQLSSNQLWFGLTPGVDLQWLAAAPGTGYLPGDAFPIATSQVALNLQNPTYGTAGLFKNATGNGANNWKNMSYAELANAYYRGIALQPAFSNVNADNPDLSAFKARGGKLVVTHGWLDAVISPAGTVNYYTRSANFMGGFEETQKFHRLFMVPGMGHSGGTGRNGISGVSPPSNPPIVSRSLSEPTYQALKNWVEHGVAPDQIVLTTEDNVRSRPMCPYPRKMKYTSGDVSKAASFTCA